MSRIGNIPVKVPSGVEFACDGDTVRIKGGKGSLERTLTGGVKASFEDGQIKVTRPDDSSQSKALHGLYRSLIAGMVEGVSEGFERRLEIVGVSYQGAVEGGRLKLQVGFSHPVYVDIPKGINVECPSQTMVVVTGCDKQMVGEFAARVRRVRPPEPYKGKGVRYAGENIVQKAGKSFVGGEK